MRPNAPSARNCRGLGVLYEGGRGGLAKNDHEAARLFKLAADQGNAVAQYILGVFYESDRGGLAKNDREEPYVSTSSPLNRAMRMLSLR